MVERVESALHAFEQAAGLAGHAVHVADELVGGGGDVGHVVHRVGAVGQILHALSQTVDEFGADMCIFEHLVQFGSERVFADGQVGGLLDGVAVLVVFHFAVDGGFVDHAGQFGVDKAPVPFFVRRFESREEEDDAFDAHTGDKHHVCTGPVHDFEQCTNDNDGCAPAIEISHEGLVAFTANEIVNEAHNSNVFVLLIYKCVFSLLYVCLVCFTVPRWRRCAGCRPSHGPDRAARSGNRCSTWRCP